jgi:hypothetical protein
VSTTGGQQQQGVWCFFVAHKQAQKSATLTEKPASASFSPVDKGLKKASKSPRQPKTAYLPWDSRRMVGIGLYMFNKKALLRILAFSLL